jgi:hypothetical protein
MPAWLSSGRRQRTKRLEKSASEGDTTIDDRSGGSPLTILSSGEEPAVEGFNNRPDLPTAPVATKMPPPPTPTNNPPQRIPKDLCNFSVLLADHLGCEISRARQPEPRARLLSPRLGCDKTRSNSPTVSLPGEVSRHNSVITCIERQFRRTAPPARYAGCAGSDGTNPGSAPLKPDWHESFDADIRFPMIYGKR